MSVPWNLRLARLVLLATILCGFPAVLCVIMNRIRIIGIFILTLAVIAPQAALADWKIYYTGPAANMFGSYGRGSFATRAEAEAYRVNRPGFEVKYSYSAGFDSPTYKPPSSTRSSSTRALIAGTLMQSFLDGMNSANANAQQAELNRQLAEQRRLLEKQRARAARILSANRLRRFWDGQDRESSASLSSVLDVPLQGTALFGIPSNPSSSAIRDMLANPAPVDPFANDPNVVDLRGIENPTLALLRGATDPTPAESGGPAGLQQGAAYVPPSVTPSQAGAQQGAAHGATSNRFPPASAAQTPFSAMTPEWPAPPRPGNIDWAGQGRAICKDIFIDIVLHAAPGHWRAELIASHGEKMNRFIENLFKVIEPKELVTTGVNGSPADCARMLKRLEGVEREATRLGVTNSPMEAVLYKGLPGKPISMKELAQLALSSVRRMIIEKNLGRLVWGGMQR